MLQVLRNEAGLYQALRPSYSMMTRVLYLSRPPLNRLSALKEKNPDKFPLDVKLHRELFCRGHGLYSFVKGRNPS